MKHEAVQEWAATLPPEQQLTLLFWRRNMMNIRNLGDMGQSELIYEILNKELSIRRKNAR
jgi:hypothetical protein